jgi:hypothetical protein
MENQQSRTTSMHNELPTNGSKDLFLLCIDWYLRPLQTMTNEDFCYISSGSIHTVYPYFGTQVNSVAQNAAAVMTDVTRRMICGGPR